MHAHNSPSVTGRQEQTRPANAAGEVGEDHAASTRSRVRAGLGTAGKPRGAPSWTLTDEDRTAIHAAVAALPPLTDEQVDALCDIIIAARKRWQREDSAP
jgi:hypothetical protein